MLSVKNLCVRRGDFSASLLSLEIAAGECAALCGVSGSGKSTILEAVGLLNTNFDCDAFLIDGIDVKSLAERDAQRLRGALMGIMPQTGGLLPYLSVMESIELQLRCALRCGVERDDDGSCRFVRGGAQKDLLRERLKDVSDLADAFEIADCLDRRPAELSVGQRQRALFLRAVAHRPKLVLADEPTSALDPVNAQRMFDSLKTAAARFSQAVLIVTHDVHSVMTLKRYGFSEELSSPRHSFFKEGA